MENQTAVPIGVIPTDPNDQVVEIKLGLGAIMICVSFN